MRSGGHRGDDSGHDSHSLEIFDHSYNKFPNSNQSRLSRERMSVLSNLQQLLNVTWGPEDWAGCLQSHH